MISFFFLFDLVVGVQILEMELLVQKLLLFLVIILKMSRLMGIYPLCPLNIFVF